MRWPERPSGGVGGAEHFGGEQRCEADGGDIGVDGIRSLSQQRYDKPEGNESVRYLGNAQMNVLGTQRIVLLGPTNAQSTGARGDKAEFNSHCHLGI